MPAIDHSALLRFEIAVPALTAVILLLLIPGYAFRNRLRTVFCPCIQKRKFNVFNAQPVGHYEPLRRWSNTSWTTSAAQSRRQPSDMEILSIAELGAQTHADVSPVAPPKRPADIALRAPIALHWHTRQQNRAALNDTALRTLREAQTRKSSTGPSRPTNGRKQREPGRPSAMWEDSRKLDIGDGVATRFGVSARVSENTSSVGGRDVLGDDGLEAGVDQRAMCR